MQQILLNNFHHLKKYLPNTIFKGSTTNKENVKRVKSRNTANQIKIAII